LRGLSSGVRAVRWGVAALLILGGVWLSLACLANAASRAYADAEPSTALAWDPSNPHARSRLAELYSESRATAADSRTAQDLARSALTLAPLDGAALRVLGVEAQRAGDLEGAATLMAASDRVTQRDSTAQLWLLDQAIRRGEYDLAYAKAEVVLRGAPAAGPQVFPVMRMGLADPRALPPLVKRLVRRPEWREAFLRDVAANAEDLGVASRLHAALSSSPAPPTEAETASFIKRLVASGDYPGAYALWRRLATSPAGAGVYAGDFRPRPGPVPFNWSLAQTGDAVAELGEAPRGGPALHAEFATGANADLATQLLMLPPGAYRLQGAAWLGQAGRPGRLAWSVACAGQKTLLGEARQGEGPPQEWRDFDMRFVVPPTGCGAQWLRLRSFAQDTFTTAEAWYRGVSVTAAAASPPPLVADLAAGARR